MIGLEEFLELVASLPEWERNDEGYSLDDDPVWVRRITTLGAKHYYASASDAQEFQHKVRGLDLDGDEYPDPVEIDTELIKYCGQPYVRLDVVHWYLSNEELFDPEGWYGNDYPIVMEWKDGYVVLDGNHRIMANRIARRPSKVIIASQKNPAP